MRALIESTALQTAEAALTGESLPVSKDTSTDHRRSPAWRPAQHGLQRHSGNLRTRQALVVGNGHADRDGPHRRNAEETPDETTPLQRELDRTGKMLGVVVVAIAIVMIVTIILVEDVRGLAALFEC